MIQTRVYHSKIEINVISTVIFDLSEVYLRGLLGVEEYLGRAIGDQVTNAHLQGEELRQLFLGYITEEEYWNSMISKRNWKITSAKLKELVRENFSEISGTREIIKELKAKGYYLGLISNHAREWIEYCEDKFEYQNLFDCIVYSFDVALLKPDHRIYRAFLEKSRVNPRESVFIDDLKINLSPAADLGIKVLQFTEPLTLRLQLHSMGLEISCNSEIPILETNNTE